MPTVFLVLAFMVLGRDPKSLFPIVLDTWGQLIEMREEACNLPDILLAERFVPCRHSGVTHARTDRVEEVPFGVVERIENNLRGWRIHGVLEQAWLVV